MNAKQLQPSYCPRPNMFAPGKPNFPTELNERSWLLVDIMETNGDWLQNEVTEWENSDQNIVERATNAHVSYKHHLYKHRQAEIWLRFG